MKTNVHGRDSLGVEWQQYSYIPETSPSLVNKCLALEGAD
jgi:hypothetical protein